VAKFIYFDYNLKYMNIQYINTIEDRIKDNESWKKVEKNLKKFKETIKLVKQYHIKPTQRALPSSHYKLPRDLFPYLF